MRVLIQGTIVDFVPSFSGRVDAGALVIDEAGDLALTVDTGFSGGIALPEETLEELETDFIGYDTFTLATGEIIELPMYLGKVAVGKGKITTWFIPGDFLLGMEFLSSVGSVLSLNLKDETVRLMR
jgi:predicted aspartyl protease